MNERAAVLGQIGKAQDRVKSFEREVLRFEEMLAKAKLRKESAQQQVAEKQRALTALDTSISLVDSRVRADAAGCLVPWKDKYGPRGALSGFVREVLRNASPHPISGAELTKITAEHFNLKLLTPPERKAFRDTVKTVLHLAVQRDGVAERLQKTDAKQRNAFYRWKGPTSLASLRALTRAAQEPEYGPPADPL